MEKHLGMIARSYDRAIDYGRKGIDLYRELPGHITNDPDYPAWKAEMENGHGGSESKRIKDYLLPDVNMHFIDLGCALNLMFKGYDAWPSTYHGIDISPKTIALLCEFVAGKQLSIGSLRCGSIHETPYEDGCFDIGTCIGVLEYFERDFIHKAIVEAHRIIKPGGRFVLDIPNTQSPAGRMMMSIEAYMGRPDRFDMSPKDFEALLDGYFDIVERSGASAEAMGIFCCLKRTN